jgi:hypothetical protein
MIRRRIRNVTEDFLLIFLRANAAPLRALGFAGYHETAEPHSFGLMGTTGTDAACLHPDNDEHLWTGYVVIEKRSEWEGCGDGAQAGFWRAPETSIFLLRDIGSRLVAPDSSNLLILWLRGLDLNQGPLGYEPNELPDCSTPHLDSNNRSAQGQTAPPRRLSSFQAVAKVVICLDGG